MAEKLSVVQLTGGPKDGHEFSWVGSLPKHLYFSADPNDNDPDILSHSSLAPYLVYEYVNRRTDVASGRAFEFYRFIKRKP